MPTAMQSLANKLPEDANPEDTRVGEITRQKILDAAETLIIEHGFAATSLRAIAKTAGVNLAATHYHFGSKQGLLAAVFHRRMGPVGSARVTALKQLRSNAAARRQPLTVRGVLEAFYSPFHDAINDQLINILPGLVARMYAEPASLTKPIMEGEFSEVLSHYVAALHEARPDVPLAELRWRFHFMIGAMIQLLQFNTPLGESSDTNSLQGGLQRLLDFTVAGIEQVGANR